MGGLARVPLVLWRLLRVVVHVLHGMAVMALRFPALDAAGRQARIQWWSAGLLRAVGVACRFHGFTIDKALQRGAITGLAYRLAPRNIIHSWVEVWSGEQWVQLEGFILDRKYLGALQKQFARHRGAF